MFFSQNFINRKNIKEVYFSIKPFLKLFSIFLLRQKAVKIKQYVSYIICAILKFQKIVETVSTNKKFQKRLFKARIPNFYFC